MGCCFRTKIEQTKEADLANYFESIEEEIPVVQAKSILRNTLQHSTNKMLKNNKSDNRK